MNTGNMNRLKARQNKGESSNNGALCRNEILHQEKENLSNVTERRKRTAVA